MRLRGALSRVVFCGVLLLASAGPAAAEAEKVLEKAEQKDKLLLPAVPVVAYSRETNFLFGAMMVRALRWKDAAAGARPNTIALSGFYSLENQWAVGFAPSVYLSGEDYLVKAQIYHHRTPARMWGVGTAAGERGTREDFTATGTGVTLGATRKVFRSLRIGPGIWFGSATIPIKEAGGILDRKALTGSDGGADVGLELQAEWDGRDNIYAPTTGSFVQFWAGLHRDYLGSDFDYEDYLLDVRRFFPLGGGQVLALQAKGRIMTGAPPFYRLPTIGGIGMMRGLFDGRFRDRTMAAAQLEYRFPIWKLLGGAVFAGLGEVADRPADLSLADLQFTGGAGLRVTLDPKERINLRIDLGFSNYGTFPIVVITEAF
ncbi:MAG: BamA/TamA family outer membrane protein [Candidatus Methylomirabilia bacterium]